ncbi:DNA replication licensing factor, mcm4 component [Balamuthia mandrillaris]
MDSPPSSPLSFSSGLSSPLEFPDSPPLGRRFDPLSTLEGARDLLSADAASIANGANFSAPSKDTYSQTLGQTLIWGTTVNVATCQSQFEEFFLEYREEQDQGDESLYMQLLRKAKDTENPNLNIDCAHLHAYNRELYRQLVLYPQEVIPLFDCVVHKLLREMYEEEGLPLEGIEQVQVRTFNLQETKPMRSLNPTDIDTLISVQGMVTRSSAIMPDMKEGFFRCMLCSNTTTVHIDRGRLNEPTFCNNCHATHTMQLIHNRCIFADKQITKLQETPESIPEGETPHTVNLYVYDSLVDVGKPGDRVVVTGIYRACPIRTNSRQRGVRSIYRTYLDVIHFKKMEQNRVGVEDIRSDEQTTPFDESAIVDARIREKRKKLLELAALPDIYERLAKSIAPSIWEMDDVKKGILCQLFGGTTKKFTSAAAPRCRGEINILLCGDPGTSKSQLLSYVHKIAPRGIYTSGKGSSAVGLTAYITKDPDTKQTVLESGALVLSDRGVCCIDEFDKMSDQTRSVLHEAMEQQTVSVAKAGIICTLNARTSILASANPKESRYNPRLSVVANLQLPPTLISRFDLIFLVLDKPNRETDARLARHIVSLYTREHKTHQDVIDPETLRDYIAYARSKVHPVISEEAGDAMARQYVRMRKHHEGNRRRTITATTRQLESLIRLAEAHARIRFSPTVEVQDVEEATRLIQVALQQAAMDPRTGTIDMDLITTGRSATARERLDLLRQEVYNLLKRQAAPSKDSKFSALLERMREQSSVEIPHSELREVLEQLVAEGMLRVFGDHSNPSYSLIS